MARSTGQDTNYEKSAMDMISLGPAFFAFVGGERDADYIHDFPASGSSVARALQVYGRLLMYPWQLEIGDQLNDRSSGAKRLFSYRGA